MKIGIIKIGDVVKFTDRAKKTLGNAIKEDSKRYHIVKSIEHKGQMINFEDHTSSDIAWLKRVASISKI